MTARPDLTVGSLSKPERQSGTYRVMKATWKVPDQLVEESNPKRADVLRIDWWLGMAGKDPNAVFETADETLTTHSINLDNLKIGRTTYTRASFYPNTSTKLSYVSVGVRPVNRKGSGKCIMQTRYFNAPRAPQIADFSFNSETGVVSTTVTTDAGTDYNERYDTKYELSITNTRTGQTWNASDSSSTSTSISLSYNASDYQQLGYDDYIKVTATAFARGYVGNSKTATKTFYVAYPAKPTITSVDVPSRSLTSKCTIHLQTNHTAEHPVDRVKLQYAVNTEYEDPSLIPAADWDTSDIIDDQSCTAFSVATSDVIPQHGNHTWVRIKAYHANETVLYRYSDPVEIKDLFTPAPSATEEEIKILSAVTAEGGESAVVRLAWNADGQDDSTGTELTWSDAEDTWKSTEQPSMYQFTWSDGQYTSGNVTYQDSALITIKGLDEGVKYYIKARRYLEDETVTYSDYSNTATVITNQRPESVVAICDRYIPEGEPLSVKWTFSGYNQQTGWEIISTSGVVIASGSGSVSSAQISAERLAQVVTNNSVSFTVNVSTGSNYVTSEQQTVTIMNRPAISVNAPSTLTRQDAAHPLTFTVTSTTICDLVVIITSQGATGQFPEGILTQAEGDTIHSDIYSPAWTSSNNSLTASVSVPSRLEFWDLCQYTLSVVAIDRATNLRSEQVLSDFTVDWTNKAVSPLGSVTLTVIDTTDSDGDHRQAVQIALAAPTGSSQTDVYDIYRMDVDKPTRIGEGFPLNYTAVDEYAPFGDELPLYYRIALRTVDGDVEFADIQYTANCKNLRFDWQDGFLELPYGITISDGYSKSVDIRDHMSGRTDGYWSKNVRRKSALSSEVIKIVQPRDIEKARLLARYAGPVFVRRPDGSAFEADVQVSELSKKNEAVSHVAFDAVEIGLTDEFALPTPFEITGATGATS